MTAMELAEYIQAIQHVRLDWLRDHLPKLDDLAAIALLELSIGYHLAIPGMEEWLIRQLSDIPIVQSMHPGDWEGQAPSLPTMEEELVNPHQTKALPKIIPLRQNTGF